MIGSLLVLATVLGTAAQAPTPAAQAPAGLTPPWEVKAMIQQVQESVNKTNAALGQLQVLTWKGTGASNYVAVVEATRREVMAISVGLGHLADHPEKLSAVIRIFLALQQLEPNLDSLSRAARQFQGPEAGRAMEDATNGLLNQREKLVKYVLELADFLESNSAITQQELESCQQQLWKRPPPPPTRAYPRR